MTIAVFIFISNTKVLFLNLCTLSNFTRFIVGKTTSRNDSTMTGQEDEAPGVNGDKEEEEDGFNDMRREDEKRNK